MSDERNLGETGQFPQGQYTKDDEGEIRLAVGAGLACKKVIIDFGHPVAWLAMDPDQADALSDNIRAQAVRARGGAVTGDTFTMLARVRERMMRAEGALSDLIAVLSHGCPADALGALKAAQKTLALGTQPATFEKQESGPDGE